MTSGVVAVLLPKGGVGEQLLDLGRHLGDVVGEHPGLVVDDRLGHTPREREGHSRRPVEAGLDDGESPALLVGRHEHDPRAGEERALDVFVDETMEANPVGHPTPACVLTQLVIPVPTAHHVEGEVGETRGEVGDDVDRGLEVLVRHEAAEHHEAGIVRSLELGIGVEIRRDVVARVGDRDAVEVDTEGRQVGLRRLRHRDVLTPAVHERSEPRLDEPSDSPEDWTEDDGPLVTVHVMDQAHHGGTADHGRPEGDPVVDVDDDVDLAADLAQELETAQVAGQSTAATDDPDVAAVDATGRTGEGRGEQGHGVAVRTEDLRRALHVHLGATRLRVIAVAPRQDEDAQRPATAARLVHPAPIMGLTGISYRLGYGTRMGSRARPDLPAPPCEICSGPTAPWHLRRGGQVERCRVCGHVRRSLSDAPGNHRDAAYGGDPAMDTVRTALTYRALRELRHARVGLRDRLRQRCAAQALPRDGVAIAGVDPDQLARRARRGRPAARDSLARVGGGRPGSMPSRPTWSWECTSSST